MTHRRLVRLARLVLGVVLLTLALGVLDPAASYPWQLLGVFIFVNGVLVLLGR